MNVRWAKVYSGSHGSVHRTRGAHRHTRSPRGDELFHRIVVAAVAFGITGFVLLTIGSALVGH